MPDAQVVIGEPRYNFGTGTTPSNGAYPSNLRCGVPLEDLDGVGGANDCPPASRHGAGFGPSGNQATGYPAGTNAYFWRFLKYTYDATTAPLGDNRLYVGTLDFGRNRSGAIPGFDLIASVDGTEWSTISNDRAGDPNQPGMRAINSSPFGLFIGSANPARSSNPAGGTSVWIGLPGNDKLAPATTITSPPSPVEGATVNAHSVGLSWTATDAPAPGSLPLTYAYRLDPVEPAFSSFGAAKSVTYAQVPDGAYTFYVVAKDQAGNAETPGAGPGASNRRSFTISAPDAPPSIAIQVAPSSPNATGNVTFSWKGTDDLTPASGLSYDFWLAPSQADPATFVSSTSTAYNGLADGSYVFHVMARDGSGNVSTEATAAFTVAHPSVPPVAPSPAAAAGAGVIRVTWTNVAGETSYIVDRCQGKSMCFAFNSIATPAADTTSINDTPPGGWSYVYRVRACNASGCSPLAQTNFVMLP